MSILIKGMEMPKENEVICIFPNGIVQKRVIKWSELYEVLERSNAVPVPPHGRLIDESKISLAEYEQAAHDALHNGKGSILYDSGVLAGARAITKLVRNAPTIIEAEEGD